MTSQLQMQTKFNDSAPFNESSGTGWTVSEYGFRWALALWGKYQLISFNEAIKVSESDVMFVWTHAADLMPMLRWGCLWAERLLIGVWEASDYLAQCFNGGSLGIGAAGEEEYWRTARRFLCCGTSSTLTNPSLFWQGSHSSFLCTVIMHTNKPTAFVFLHL